MSAAPSVAVTGASGFVGGNVHRHLAEHGSRVVSLGRRPGPGIDGHRQFTLGHEPDPDLFEGIDVLVHCAYDFAPRSPGEIYSRNVIGTASLFRAAVRAGVRVVLISSMSAYAGTRQIYGRAKLESEQLVHEIGGVALRLGLVWGGEDAGGMAGAVQKLVGIPLVPLLGGRSHQFTVHRDDVDAAVAAVIAHPEITGVLSVAHPAPVPNAVLFKGLGDLAGDSRTGRFVPVPWRPVYAAMRLAEAVRVPLPLRADSLLGLVRPADATVGTSRWNQVGVAFREFPIAS